jgi:hypothetical protein
VAWPPLPPPRYSPPAGVRCRAMGRVRGRASPTPTPTPTSTPTPTPTPNQVLAADGMRQAALVDALVAQLVATEGGGLAEVRCFEVEGRG